LFSSYGEGAQPVMEQLLLSDKSYISVSNIYMLSDHTYEGLYIFKSHDIIVDGITVDGQRIMECYKFTLVMIYQSHHIIFKNNIVKDGGTQAISHIGGGFYIYNDCHDILVENNLVYNQVNNCLQCGCDFDSPYYDYNIIFRGNTAYNEEGYYDDCRGIVVGWKTYGVIVENNIVYNTKTMLIGTDTDEHDTIIRNNLLYYTIDSGYADFIDILAIEHGENRNSNIYNNSLFHLSHAPGSFFLLRTYDTRISLGHKLYNNLCVSYNPEVAFINASRWNADIPNASPVEFTSDYNLYYSMVPSGPFVYKSVKYDNLEEWREGTGQDQHSIYTNPLFRGIESVSDYDIYSTSGDEMLSNPSFTSDTAGWTYYFAPETGAAGSFSRTTAPGEYATAPAALKVNCTANTSTYYGIQLIDDADLHLESDKWYIMSFKAKASREFRISRIGLIQSQAPWAPYTYEEVDREPTITMDWQTYRVLFYTSQAASDARITWLLGNGMPAGATFYIDDVSFKLADDLNNSPLPDIEDFVTPDDSSCIDAGIALDDVTDDFLGNPRPQGEGYDIGAYERR
jgi:hypothetical protein